MISEPPLPEVLAVLAISTLGSLFVPAAKPAFLLLPVLYSLAEKRLRRRSWKDLGFFPSALAGDFRKAWFLFLFAGIGSRSITAYSARYFFPAYLDHVRERLPFGAGTGLVILIPAIGLSLVGEEMSFRGLYQKNLRRIFGLPAAVVMSSALFSLMRYSPAPEAVLVLDLGSIFIDNLLYGILFARSGNILFVWASHFLGNVVGLFFLL
jgi:membrane protease YdiL (CAAX protease family)